MRRSCNAAISSREAISIGLSSSRRGADDHVRLHVSTLRIMRYIFLCCAFQCLSRLPISAGLKWQ